MFNAYTASNWYWKVAGSAVQVYSSAAAAYVPVNNPSYVAWLANGNVPTLIDTEANLWDVLAAQWPAGLPSGNPAALDRFAQGQLDAFSKLLFQAFLNHENRIRVLEGKPTVTAAQFMAGLKALLTTTT